MPKPLISSRSWRLTYLYRILNKQKQSIVFKPNKIQQDILDYKRECREQKRPIRFIVLKARQWGVTTEEVIDALDEALFYSNIDATITAHTLGKAQEIFRIVKYAYEQLPNTILLSDWNIWEKPKTTYESKTELYFENNNSRIKVVRDARSITPSRVHITELAFMNDAESLITANEWGIPDSASLSYETTANGIAWQWWPFYQLWRENYNRTWALFKTFFFPWFDVEEYRSDTPLKELDRDYYEFEFAHYLERLKLKWLDEKQISWYIQKAKKLKEKVLQEYPIDPEDAFLSTNRSIFSLDEVKKNQSIVDSLNKKFVIDSLYPDLRFYHTDNGSPIPEKDICIWVDVAEWVGWWDYSTMVWRRRKDLKLLFTYRWHIKPDEMPIIIDRVYKYWYQWLVWIERNNHWHATISASKEYSYYYDLYSQKTIDRRTNKEMKKLWWHTSGASKSVMISHMNKCIRTWELVEFDVREYQELFTFVMEWTTMGAIAPDHDDLIIADAICLQMSLQGFDSVA